jgi:GNAT superfamily N-acetyltransferase
MKKTVIFLLGALSMHAVHSIIEFKYLKDCPEHVTTCAQWSFNSWGKYTPHRTFEDYLESRKEHLNDDSLPLTIVAFSDQTPIGMCSLVPSRDADLTLTPWFATLYVEPEFREQKIATALEKAICEKARSMGYTKIYSFNSDPTVVPWYEKLGWKQRNVQELYNHEVTVLEKELT